jgi:hypothetical protein
MKRFFIEVWDSDGSDSGREVFAADVKSARRKAIDAHYCEAGYSDWRDEDSACPAIVNVTVTE